MKRTTLLFAAAVLCLGSAHATEKDQYPSRAISVIVPYAAGGTNDVLARLVANKMSNQLGVSVLVENRPGAGGNIGARHVTAAEPDGYTIGAVPVGVLAINQWVYSDPGFDAQKDLIPITLAGHVPNVIVATPSLPANTIAELIEYAKAHPGEISFASMGTGTTGHLCAELFKLQTQTDMPHVPYKGAAPALTDLMGGHVQLMCDNLTNALPHIQSVKIKALAVTSSARAPKLPDVPTVQEAGLKDFEATAWFGFAAPARTPADRLETLNAAIVKALNDPDVQQKLEGLGMDVVGNTTAEFAAFVNSETGKWREVVERSGAKAN